MGGALWQIGENTVYYYEAGYSFLIFSLNIGITQLNLKFEIEVLCKNLALDINELKPGNLLKDKDRLKNLDEQLSAPKKDVKQPEELPPITTTSKCDN